MSVTALPMNSRSAVLPNCNATTYRTKRCYNESDKQHRSLISIVKVSSAVYRFLEDYRQHLMFPIRASSASIREIRCAPHFMVFDHHYTLTAQQSTCRLVAYLQA